MSQDLELLYNKNDMYTEYSNDNFDYYYPTSFDNRNKCYLLSRYTPTAMWDYGDTVTITFNIHELGLDDSVSMNAEGENILITFYNERCEKLDFQYEVAFAEQLTVGIDYDVSIKQFKRGVYSCQVQLVSYDEDGTTIGSMQTILPINTCLFYIQ